MLKRMIKNTLPALILVWIFFFTGMLISDQEGEAGAEVFFLQHFKVFISYTALGLITGGISAGILARKRKKYSFYFESEQDKYHKYFLKNAGISFLALFSLTAREVINHPALFSESLLSGSFWFYHVFSFLRDKFSPLYFTVFFFIIILMSIHNLLYNLSIYQGAKRIISYSLSIGMGIALIFNFGYLNALEVKEQKNIIFIGVENLTYKQISGRKINALPALKELTGSSYRFSNCFSVSNHPRVSLLSVLTSVHPEKGNYTGGYRSYGLEGRTVFSILGERGYSTGTFTDRKYAFSRFEDNNEYLVKYPTKMEIYKAGVLSAHFLMPVVYNSRTMIKVFPEALILDGYRDKTYMKGKISDLISGKNKFMFLYVISDQNDRLPFPYYRTSRFESTEDAFLNYLNDEINDIYQRLKSSGKYENTVICLFGLPAYKNTVRAADYRMPFVLSSPEFKIERSVKNDYSSLDILPTVLDAAGVVSPGAALDGISFFDPEFVRQDIVITDVTPIKFNDEVYFKNEEGYVSKNIFAEKEIYPRLNRAMIRGDFKLSVLPGSDEVAYELHDIIKDPDEKTNLIKQNPSLASKMKSIYEEKMNKEFNFKVINGYVLK